MSKQEREPFPVLKTTGPAYRKRQALMYAPFFAPNPGNSAPTFITPAPPRGRIRIPGKLVTLPPPQNKVEKRWAGNLLTRQKQNSEQPWNIRERIRDWRGKKKDD